jgi:hypothetical protein
MKFEIYKNKKKKEKKRKDRVTNPQIDAYHT